MRRKPRKEETCASAKVTNGSEMKTHAGSFSCEIGVLQGTHALEP